MPIPRSIRVKNAVQSEQINKVFAKNTSAIFATCVSEFYLYDMHQKRYILKEKLQSV